jgi:hypothetical protein
MALRTREPFDQFNIGLIKRDGSRNAVMDEPEAFGQATVG